MSSTQEQLIRENKELRNRCQFLETEQQRSKHLAQEWQSFGKYTAQVLKNEVDTANKKIKFLESRVEDLRKENKELKDVCLYLDQQEEDSKLTPPELSELLAHTKFLSKLNLQDQIPCLSDSLAALKSGALSVPCSTPPDTELREAVTELGKRVARLETEKLELVKSLSAAHLLVANTHAPTGTPLKAGTVPTVMEHPPSLAGREEVDGGRTTRNVSADAVANAVMLLDMIQRLDATELNGFKDSAEEAEVETLKVLIAIAWQRIQEQTLIENE